MENFAIPTLGICVSCIPAMEVRRVKHMGVFWFMMGAAVSAYIWLYLKGAA